MPDAVSYLARLAARLAPAYESRTVVPGHDTSHVTRMVNRAPQVTHLPSLDTAELEAAIWLHNLDRAPDLGISRASLEDAARAQLADSPFSSPARDRIAEAVGKHHLRDLPTGASPVLAALSALDKLDRMSALGVLTSATSHGITKPLYVPRDPFRYQLDADGQPFSVYDDLAGRIMEFPLLMPPEARYLIDVRDMRDLVAYVRALAGYACRSHGLENGAELDLARALGPELHKEYGNA